MYTINSSHPSIMLLLGIVLIGAFADPVSAADGIPATTFKIAYKEGGFKEADQLSIDASAISAGEITKLGFPKAACTETPNGDGWSFSAQAQDAKGNTVRWEGTVNGYQIDGTVTVTNRDTKETQGYAFTGIDTKHKSPKGRRRR